MKKSRLVLTLGLALLLMFTFSSINIKYSTEIVDPLYKDLTGRLFIKTADHKIIRHISMDFINGESNKVDIPLTSIDLNSFKKRDTIDRPILQFEDKNYRYTLHDGEDKFFLRKQK